MEVEEYVDFKYEFVEREIIEARTTGSSLNTSVKILTLILTNTRWKYKWSLSMLFQVAGYLSVQLLSLHSKFITMQRIQHSFQSLQEVGL